MASRKSAELNAMIKTIYAKGSYSPEGQTAIRTLCQRGVDGLEAMLDSTQRVPPSDLHPRDLWDTVSDVYWHFAAVISEELIARMDDERLGRAQAYWALGNAKDQHSIDVLIEGVRDRSMWNRWCAVESLLRRKPKRAIHALVGRLKDRSSLVKASIVQNMMSSHWLRCPEAIPLLRKLADSKTTQKHSPGTWEMAGKILNEMGVKS